MDKSVAASRLLHAESQEEVSPLALPLLDGTQNPDKDWNYSTLVLAKESGEVYAVEHSVFALEHSSHELIGYVIV